MDTRLINIQFKDGKVKRLPRDQASDLVDEGKAKYISNTLYKAAVAGVTVKRGMSEAQIKHAIRKLHKPEPEPVEKERQPQQRRRKKGKKNKEVQETATTSAS